MRTSNVRELFLSYYIIWSAERRIGLLLLRKIRYVEERKPSAASRHNLCMKLRNFVSTDFASVKTERERERDEDEDEHYLRYARLSDGYPLTDGFVY